jgi:uncharacterized membrane protein YfcA
MQIFLMVVVGLITGVFAGVFGVGGGVVLVPILVLGFRYTQQAASGTSLVALLLPVGFLGVVEYYKAGKLSTDQIKLGLIIAVGLFFGTYFGARIGAALPARVLQRSFAVFMILIAAKLWFSPA